jgi:uncharacterized protein (TIGR02996 family)
MARYELAGRYWSIARGADGTSLTTTSGTRDAAGRSTTRHYASAAAAEAQLEAMVREKLRAGYRAVELAAAPADADAAALEARIAEDPADEAAYAVYGDWLQRQGDPRGELIALQLAREAELARAGVPSIEPPRHSAALPVGGKPRPSRLARAIGTLVERQASVLLGDLAGLVPDVRELEAEPLIWRRGFIHRVVLDRRAGELGAIVGQILGHPSGRFVRELVVRCEDVDEAHRVVDVLCERVPPALSELELFVRGQLLDLGALWPAVAGLRRISITARGFDLGAVRVPRVERARFVTARLSSVDLRAIAAAPWPALQRLELRFAGRSEPNGATLADLQRLLERDDLPALTHLKLRGCEHAGEALTTLAQAPLGRQLVVIDLSHGLVEAIDLRALAHHRASFPALRELWLPGSVVPEARRLVEGIATHLLSDARAAQDTFADDMAPASR